MADPLLVEKLAPIAESHDRSRLRSLQARVWCGAALAGLALLVLHHTDMAEQPWWSWILLAGLALGTNLLLRRRQRRTEVLQIARRVEAHHPELHQLLLTAVEVEPDRRTGQLGYLQKRVIREALDQDRRRPWNQRDNERYFFAQSFHLFAQLAFAAVALGLLLSSRPWSPDGASRSSYRVLVEPGNAEMERGSSLVVTATFREEEAPAEATLVLLPSAQAPRRIPLSRNLADPVFGTSLLSVDSDTLYSIEFGEESSEQYRLSVFDFPDLEQANAVVEPPGYTGLPDREIADTRRITAPEGSLLTCQLVLNKADIRGTLTREDGTEVPLHRDESSPSALEFSATLEEDLSYRLDLVDSEGRRNKSPIELTVKVVGNRTPEMRLTSPYEDSRFSPIEEVAFEGEISDDYGLVDYGLAYSIGSEEPVLLRTGSGSEAGQKVLVDHLLELENHDTPPKTLISYYLWADDLGPDGEFRRSYSDMFLAQIRPFEEIYTEGQGGGGMSEEPELMKLARIQKEIIDATWNIQRRETGRTPTAAFLEDVGVVEESQTTVRSRLEIEAGRISGEQAQEIVQQALDDMESARERLEAAAGEASPPILGEALPHARNAYQRLLQLMPDNYQVSRDGSASSSGRSNRSQQLDQLELSDDSDLYETQSQAETRPDEEAEEQMQILNRLKELARRQQDLNQRLQELQTALEEARNDQEREEIEHQLKRLREEQRQMVEDMDELRQRMSGQDASSNPQDLSQLDQIREQAQEAGESLDQGEISQSLASGTRAEQGLEELRDDYQRENSRRFSQEMRDLRQRAQELSERQDSIQEDLRTAAEDERKTLDIPPEIERAMENAQLQQEELDGILGEVRSISEEAEDVEPILSRQLHEAYRSTDPDQVDQQLEIARQLARFNQIEQAQLHEDQAHQAIDELSDRIDRAAESILGDGIESLRQAELTLDELLEDVRQEIAQNMREPGQQSGSAQPGEDSSGQQGQTGEQPSNPGSPGNTPAQSGGGRQGTSQAQGGQSQQEGNSGQGGRGAPQGQDSPGGRQGGPGGTPAGQDGQAPGQGRSWNLASAGGSGGSGGNARRGPLTGDQFRDFSDRLRGVEEMIDVPELQNEVSTVRDRSRAVRIDYSRNGKEPQWDLVQMEIEAPLAEILQQVREELARRIDRDAVVPIDRDPVPRQYSELVRRYYESLGEGSQSRQPQE